MRIMLSTYIVKVCTPEFISLTAQNWGSDDENKIKDIGKGELCEKKENCGEIVKKFRC